MNPNLEKIAVAFKKQPVGIICGLVCVALGVTDYLRSDLQGDLEKTRDEKTAEARRLEGNLSKAARMKEQTDALAAANQSVKERTVKPKDLTTNFQYYYRLEADSGVKLVTLNQTGVSAAPAGAPPTNYVPVSYSVSLQGEFSQVLDFLRRLEHGAHFARVNSCVLASAAQQGDASAKLTVDLKLDLLGQPVVAAAVPPAAATDLTPVAKRAASVDLAQNLLRTRVAAPPLSAAEVKDPFNPPDFRPHDLVAATPAAPTSSDPVVIQANSDRQTLAKIAPLIMPDGTFTFGNEILLVYGQKRLRVGDTLPLMFEGKPYELIISAISGGTFTLRLNGEEITRSIKPDSK